MSLFNLFKKPEPQKQQKEQSFEEYMTDLRKQRMKELQPALSRGSAENAPSGFDHFNLNDVVIGKSKEGYIHYLFAGDNAATLIHDLQAVNKLAYTANKLVPGLPNFIIDSAEIAFDPFPDKARQMWLFSKLIIEGLTETGKTKKYPVSAIIETITGEKSGRLYYTLDGKIGKGNITIHLFPNTDKFINYGFNFINGVVSHVWESKQEKKELYNKNHDL